MLNKIKPLTNDEINNIFKLSFSHFNIYKILNIKNWINL